MNNAVQSIAVLFLFFLFFFKVLFIYFQREGKGRRKQGKETSMYGCLSRAPNWGPGLQLACNPGMCPDWELNQRPFGSQSGTQSTELHQPGLCHSFDQRTKTKEFRRPGSKYLLCSLFPREVEPDTGTCSHIKSHVERGPREGRA